MLGTGPFPSFTSDETVRSTITDSIRTRAYYIWLSRGFPDGEALYNWRQAEDEFLFSRRVDD